MDAIGQSLYSRLLDIRVEVVGEGAVRGHLPFAPGLAAIGDQVSGGALASLIDVAATAAAWCTDALPRSPRGTTIAFQIQFPAAARAEPVVAEARFVQRGHSITVFEVIGRAPDGRSVVQALVTYKLIGEKPPAAAIETVIEQAEKIAR